MTHHPDLIRMARDMRKAYAAHNRDFDIVPWEKAKSKEPWIICATAALQSLRTPSLDVVEAGMDAVNPIDCCSIDESEARRFIAAMIDVIAGEGK